MYLAKTDINKNGSSLDLGSFSVQLSRSDNFDHLDLATVNERKRIGSARCAVSGK